MVVRCLGSQMKVPKISFAWALIPAGFPCPKSFCVRIFITSHDSVWVSSVPPKRCPLELQFHFHTRKITGGGPNVPLKEWRAGGRVAIVQSQASVAIWASSLPSATSESQQKFPFTVCPGGTESLCTMPSVPREKFSIKLTEFRICRASLGCDLPPRWLLLRHRAVRLHDVAPN
jgi:hypothetical protein